MCKRDTNPQPKAAIIDRDVLWARRIQPLEKDRGHEGVEMVLFAVGVEKHLCSLIAASSVSSCVQGRRYDTTCDQHRYHKQGILILRIESHEVLFADQWHPWATSLEEVPQKTLSQCPLRNLQRRHISSDFGLETVQGTCLGA